MHHACGFQNHIDGANFINLPNVNFFPSNECLILCWSLGELLPITSNLQHNTYLCELIYEIKIVKEK